MDASPTATELQAFFSLRTRAVEIVSIYQNNLEANQIGQIALSRISSLQFPEVY
jgi:hypothetical protein